MEGKRALLERNLFQQFRKNSHQFSSLPKNKKQASHIEGEDRGENRTIALLKMVRLAGWPIYVMAKVHGLVQCYFS